jgi:bifunctional enzyme CysN/CysC
VDDGKSTLIGRLLLDTGSVYVDQLEAVERASRARGDEYVDLALLTDGLRAEREQGITIDVAYRYFSTARRSFVVADCPGHIEYTRNAVTGASGADVALLLVDARKGILEQTKRHAFVASLLGVRHLVVCVNKMDLVAYEEAVFESVRQAFTAFAARLHVADVTFIPTSGLRGDNVTRRSERTPWYGGPSLLYHLENVYVAADRDLVDVRFPIQSIVRPVSDRWRDYRAFAGTVAGGILKPGDEVVVLPSGVLTRIVAIEAFDQPVSEAFPTMSVKVLLEHAVDASRGSMIARPNNRPMQARDVEALLCVVADERIAPGHRYALRHTTNLVQCQVELVRYRVDIDTLHRVVGATALAQNDIGRVHLTTSSPLLCDPYQRNRVTGCFILIDEQDNRTVAGGMILDTGTQS